MQLGFLNSKQDCIILFIFVAILDIVIYPDYKVKYKKGVKFCLEVRLAAGL